MTFEEYKQKLIEMKARYDDEKMELVKLYAYGKNKFKVGDTIEDHIGKIIITKINTALSWNEEPINMYYGLECRKDGKPKKNGSHRFVHESNLIDKYK